MNSKDKPQNRLSYAGKHPDLSKDAPVNLRQLRAARQSFDYVRDPLIAAQLRDMKKTEGQRRDESGRGSLMVKLDRPFPDLRPKHAKPELHRSFNQAWFREQRAARLAQYQQERASLQVQEQELEVFDPTQKPVREWTH